MNLTLRPSTLLLAALLLALLTTTPVPLAVTVAVVTWLLHTPVALLLGILATVAYKTLRPKAASR